MKSDDLKSSDSPMREYNNCVTHHLAQVAAQHRGLLKAKVEAMGITFAEFNIVGILLNHPAGLPQKKIADLLELTPATVSASLEKLEKKEVILRAGDPDDSRVKTVKVNMDIVNRAGEIHTMLQGLEAAAVAGLTPSELKTVKKALDLISSNLRSLQDKA